MTSLSNIFGPSPVLPIQEHMKICFESCEKLIGFFEFAIDNNWDNATKVQEEINNLERSADKLKRKIKLGLPNSFFLPIPRRDLLNLVDCQDRLANKAEDIAGTVLGRRIVLPKQIISTYMELLEQAVHSAKQANKAINELSQLVDNGFSGKEVAILRDMIVKLDKYESITDSKEIKIRNILFDLENELSPVEVIFLYKLIEWTGDLADRAQNVGGQLLLLLAR